MVDTPNNNTKKVNLELKQTIETILTDRPIAYHAVLAKAVGSATAGIFLSQLLYWTPRSQDNDSWIYKTQQEMYEETALTRREQETARRLLRQAGKSKGNSEEDEGVLEEKKAGVPSRLFFRINMNALLRLLTAVSDDDHAPEQDPQPDPSSQPTSEASSKDGGKRRRTMAESAIQGRRKPSSKNGGKRQTRMAQSDRLYNVSEITSEITTTDVAVALKKFGISHKAAGELVGSHSKEYLFDKLDQVLWLVETGSALVGKNPAGYLRKAIEDDYLPPPQYKTMAEREKEEEGRRRVANCKTCGGTGFYRRKEGQRILAFQCDHSAAKKILARV